MEQKWPQTSEAQIPPFALYKDFGRSRMLGPNGIETGVHKFVLAPLQRKARASAISLGSLAMTNML